MINKWACTLISLVFLLREAAAQCDYQQHVQKDTTYYVFSPNYPQSYEPGTQCVWAAYADAGSRIRVACTIDMPSSHRCSSDHVAVSTTDWHGQVNDRRFCGKGNFNMESEDNKMDVTLSVAASSGRHGKFLCNMTSRRDAPLPCECGHRQLTRIVGGSETGVNEFPMMAGLVDFVIRKLYCGATVVSPLFVVTAAHCLVKKSAQNIGVIVGEHDITTGYESDATKLYSPKRITLHPKYNPATAANDIALLELARPMVFSNNVGPACLPFGLQGQSIADLDVIVLGWGTTSFAGPWSDRLQQASLRVKSNNICAHAYLEFDPLTQLCTFAKATDACQGDSGGPLLYQDPVSGRLILVGVVSYGTTCADMSPGVFTRVDAFLDWILSETQDLFCQKCGQNNWTTGPCT